jgi:hypothetical protein
MLRHNGVSVVALGLVGLDFPILSHRSLSLRPGRYCDPLMQGSPKRKSSVTCPEFSTLFPKYQSTCYEGAVRLGKAKLSSIQVAPF